MYKGKLKTWGILVAILLVFSLFMQLCANVEKPYHPTIYADTGDVGIQEAVFSYDHPASEDDADILILEHSNEKREGYVKHENALYTPIVMYIMDAGLIRDMGCDIQNINYGVAYKEMLEVLVALEEGKSYSDIGITDTEIIADPSNRVRIGIPNKRSVYRKPVEEAFYFAFNGGKILDDKQRKELKPRMEELLAKCINLESVAASMEQARAYKKEEDQMIFIGPESIKGMNHAATSRRKIHYTGYFDAVYSSEMFAIGYDIYVKQKSKEITQDQIYQSLKDSDLQKKSGFRISESKELYENRTRMPGSVNVSFSVEDPVCR